MPESPDYAPKIAEARNLVAEPPTVGRTRDEYRAFELLAELAEALEVTLAHNVKLETELRAETAAGDDLEEELAAYYQALTDIRAADPALFDTSEGRGRAYETYGSGGDDLREAYVAAVAPLAAWENPHA
ncbi:hypothetical protein [Nocardia sp. NPDC004711]